MDAVTVITADIISSARSKSQVEDLRLKLLGLHHPLLITPFALSRGDEIQAVCQGALQCCRLVRQLRYICLPLRLRVGLGIGRIETGVGSQNPWDMNGSGFVRARGALDRLKRIRRPATSMDSGNERLDAVGNALLAAMDAIESRWTKGQWEAVHAYENLGTYELAGEALGVALQNVEKRCRAASWPAIRQAEEALEILGSILQDDPRVL